jgi:hypothetical protein
MVGMIDNDANVVVFLRRTGLTLTYHGRVVDGGNRINFLNTTFDWFRLRTAATTPSPSFDMADYRFVARVLSLKGPNFEQVFGRALELNAVVDENHWFRTYMRHQLEYLDADRILPIKSKLGPSPLRNVDFLNRLFFEWPSTAWTVAGEPNSAMNLFHHIAYVCTWQLDPQL